MFRAYKLLLLSIFSLFQGIYSYCIYNMLNDGSSFHVTQADSCVGYGKTFKKHMERGEETCCPYTMKDCSCHRRDHDEAKFYIRFYFAGGNPPLKLVKCKTGGGLYIHGTEDNYFAECVDENEVSTVVPLDDTPDPQFFD